jgi:hypothetical protein
VIFFLFCATPALAQESLLNKTKNEDRPCVLYTCLQGTQSQLLIKSEGVTEGNDLLKISHSMTQGKLWGYYKKLNATGDDKSPQIDDDHGYKQPIQEIFQTELVYPQEKGEVQLTISPGFRKKDGRRFFGLPVTFEYGLTDSWQVEVEWESFLYHNPADEASTRGIGDLEIGTKYSFMNIKGSDFHAAVGFEVGFPLGNVDKELSEGLIEYEPFFIIAKDFPALNNSQIFAQVGIGLVQRVKRPTDPDEEEAAAHEFSFNVGCFIPIRQLRYTTEFNFVSNRWNNNGGEKEIYSTPGLVWDLPGKWELGVGLPIGLNSGSEKFKAIAKLTFEFGGDDK